MLVAEALADCSAADARLIDDLLGAPEPREPEIDLLRSVITASGAPERVEARITALLRESLGALDEAPIVDERARRALHRLADAATARRY